MGRLTVLAGSGGLVPEVVEAARALGHEVQVLPFVARSDLGLDGTLPYDLADLQRVELAIKGFRTSHLTLAGGLDISDAARVRFAGFAGGGGNKPMGDIALSMLAGVVKARTGAKLVGAHEIAPGILIQSGKFAGPDIGAQALACARFALKVARGVGALDIGQAAVVSGERIISVEDIAGTDALLERVAAYRAAGQITGGADSPLVLGKAAKPKQPVFVDLPAIGPATIANAERAGVSIIALQAGKTILIDRSGIRGAADAAGITVLGL